MIGARMREAHLEMLLHERAGERARAAIVRANAFLLRSKYTTIHDDTTYYDIHMYIRNNRMTLTLTWRLALAFTGGVVFSNDLPARPLCMVCIVGHHKSGGYIGFCLGDRNVCV